MQEIVDEKRMKQERRKLKERKKAAPTFFDPDRESYLVADAAGSVSHLIEALLVRHCGSTAILRLRATSSFHKALVDESVNIYKKLYR